MMRFLGLCSANRKVAWRTFAWNFSCAAGVVVLSLMLTAQLGARPQAQAIGMQGGQAPSSGESDVVQGTVINRVTREPVARALVYTPDNRFAVLTDDRGHFELNFPPRDTTPRPSPKPSDDPEQVRAQQRAMQIWMLRNMRFENFSVKKPGYLALDHEIRSTSGAVSMAAMIVELEPEAHIVGHVQMPDMDGVERGQIQIYRQEFQEGQPSWRMVDTVRIRATGEFRFADLPAGTYKLFTTEQMERVPPIFNPRSQMFGYPPAYFPNSRDFASATPIRLAAGATFEVNISLLRREYYPVKISISSGAVAAGAAVVVYPQGHPGPGYELGFDPSEEAVRGFLPDGNYTVRVSTRGPEGSSGTLNFTVRGGPVEGLALALIAHIALNVNLKREFQPDSSNVEEQNSIGDFGSRSKNRIAISLAFADDFGNSRTDYTGQGSESEQSQQTFRDISPGNYWMRFRMSGGYVASASWGGTDLLRHPLVVGTDGTSTPIEVVLRDDGAEVSGMVREPGRENLPGKKDAAPRPSNATVYFVPVGDSDGQFREVRAMNGQFGLSQIPPGTYRLLAFANEQKGLDFLNPVEMRKFESKGLVLSLAPNQHENLQAPLTLVDEP